VCPRSSCARLKTDEEKDQVTETEQDHGWLGISYARLPSLEMTSWRVFSSSANLAASKSVKIRAARIVSVVALRQGDPGS
jgi:hypothetical protein